MKLIIMAGGQGTKLWPYSTEAIPKQFQTIFGSTSLYQTTLKTLLKSFSTEDILVSTKKKYLKFINKQSPQILPQNIIAEPDIPKNQGPATAYACFKLQHLYPGEPFMLIQADCIRDPEDKFLKMISNAEKLVKSTKKIISGGNRPVAPTMGIDYFQLAEKENFQTNLEVYSVEKFVYRPDTYEDVRNLIESFHVVTHSNHLCWYPELLINAVKEKKPEWYKSLNKIKDSFGKKNEEEITNNLYAQIENPGNIEEVTSEIFEKNGLIILLPFKWIDVGTWSSIYDNLSTPGKNYIDANVVTIDTKNTLIKGSKNKLIATLGVEDLVIVETENALLICKKDRAGDMKLILKNLEESGRDEYM